VRGMEREIAHTDAVCSQIFQLLEAFPRFKDQVLDKIVADSNEQRGAATSPSRGIFILQGPAKMIQTVAMVTMKGTASSTAARLKPVSSRCKWVPADEFLEATKNIRHGIEGLKERMDSYEVHREYVAVVIIELPTGELTCQHTTGRGVPNVEDRGPWEFVLDHGKERASARPSFNYNGSITPQRVSPDRPVPDHIPKPDYYASGIPTAEREADARSTPPVLNEKQIKKMRKACRLGREIVDEVHRMIKPGITTDEIDRVVHDFTIENGAYPAPLHYFNFPKSVCTSVNEVVCHGIPDLYELQDGDIVNIDVSPILDGWHADLNETLLVGNNVSQEKKNLVKAAHDALMKAMGVCKPGVFYRDLGAVITKHVNGCGFSVDKTYCGHGVGEYFHCAPNIPHYAGNKAKFTMKVGHCFTIEPMINMGTWKDTHWPDCWTAVTKDGLPSAQFEHTMVVTEGGVENLTQRLSTSPPLWWEVEERADMPIGPGLASDDERLPKANMG